MKPHRMTMYFSGTIKKKKKKRNQQVELQKLELFFI